MTEADKVTRFSAELVESAAAEGRRQSRSARQQLDHWVRVGRAVSAVGTAQRARVEAVLAGRLPMVDPSFEEGVVLNAEVMVNIEEDLASRHYGLELASEGVTTVALDGDGQLVEHRPDGSSHVLTPDPVHQP